MIMASLLLCLTAGAPAQASAPPSGAVAIVSHFFEAFAHLDSAQVTALTSGAASTDTNSIIDKIRAQARDKGVSVELRTAELRIGRPCTLGAMARVVVRFRIEVIAKKWIFTRVARELRGRATFDVTGTPANRSLHIVGIVLDLEPPMKS